MSDPTPPDPQTPPDKPPTDPKPPDTPDSDTFTIKIDGLEGLDDKMRKNIEDVITVQQAQITKLEKELSKITKESEKKEKERLLNTLKEAKYDIETIQKRNPSIEALQLLVDTIPKPDGTIVIPTKGNPKDDKPSSGITVYNPLTGKHEPWEDRYK